MAEVTRRSFDLKSWQGLTDVLRFARESNVDPATYAEFRNLVLHYAQQKGSDPELKKKIESIIASFTVKTAPQPEPATDASNNASKPEMTKSVSSTHGRRLVSSFAPLSVTPAPQEKKEEETTIEPAEHQEVPPIVEPVPVPEKNELEPLVVASVETAPVATVSQGEALKSVEEHRARIMEIKRRVNGLIGNPIMLMDHGNHIGREYMGALLNALKATSPGSTLNVEETMANLESMFVKIVEVGSHPEEATQLAEVPTQVSENVREESVIPEPSVSEEAHEPTEVMEEQVAEPLIQAEPELSVPESLPEPELVIDPEPESVPEPVPMVPEEVELQAEEPVVESEEESASVPVTPTEDQRWTESGGDADIATQIKTLREQLKSHEMSASPQTDAARVTRPIIPSIIDMEEEDVIAQNIESEPAHEAQVPENDELSTQSLAHRPLSSLTGITLGTPQAELMTPEVTAVLTQLLHDWSIFASSGLFGMGPSGVDHPLYEKLSRLPMGEVLSGRFENGDMKLVRVIKDYVNAWRHEQGIAYNPTETFEHYLRRVSQRILKRQMGTKTV